MPQTPQPNGLDLLKGDFSNDLKKYNNEAGVGKSANFDAKEVSRYVSYGSKTYGKYGYDPQRDNNKFYNAVTTGADDVSRAFTGMWKLAGIGFKDTFGFGVAAGDDAHKEFEDVMNTYSSTRGGSAGFISNTMLSSGYTVGIMGAIAAEEALLALGTAATGGLGVGGAVVETASVLGRAGKALDRAGDAVNVFKKLSNIRDARTLNWVGKQGQSITKGLLPVGETMDFLRNYDKLGDLNNFGKSLTGAGAIARDARKIYMTASESKLEANMAKDEVRNDLLNKWRTSNPGQSLPDEERQRIEKTANNVYNDVFQSNLGLIYVTNAVTFDAMFKSMRHTNKLFKMAEGLGMTVKKTGGKVAIDVAETGLIGSAKKKISGITAKSALKWTATSSMEGVQEVGQDAISEASKGYNLDVYNNRFQGSYYDHLSKALTHINPETFFSGMLMGTFASPVGHAIQSFNQFTQGGGYQKITNNTKWKQEKASALEQKQVQAKVLTEFFNQSGTFLEEDGRAQAKMTGFQEKMLEAAEKGDRKFFEDNRSEVFRHGVKTLFKNNMDAELLEHLQKMQGYSAEELNQAMDRTDVTEDNKSEHINKINDYAKRIKSYRQLYDQIETDHANPVNLKAVSHLKQGDPEYDKYVYAYHANEAYKEELLFSNEKLSEYGSRMKTLAQTLTSDQGLTTTDLSNLVTPADMALEINRLKQEVKNNKEYDISDPITERKLEAMQKYQMALTKYDQISDPESNFEVQKEMREAFNEYQNAVLDRPNSIPNAVENDKKFDALWDYMNLGDERKALQDHVNTILDPLYATRFVDRLTETMKKRDANKEQLIYDSLKAFEERKTSDQVMEALTDENMIFDMREIDDLIQHGIMPDKFYDLTTHEELKGDRLKQAQAIVSEHYKKLTNKKIVTKEGAYTSRQKFDNDKRTTGAIVRQYAKSKLNSDVSIATMINRLLSSSFITGREKALLEKLQDLDLTGYKIQLTTDAESPIAISEDKTIVIDVRHSGSDYKNGSTPFEYLAISALLQAHLSNKMENNPSYKEDVVNAMEQARMAYSTTENLGAVDVNKIGLFNDPVIFMSEALNNIWFQDFLADIEDTNSPDGITSVWDEFKDMTKKVLDQDFDGKLLDRSMNLATLALTDEQIDSVTEENQPIAASVSQEEIASTEKSAADIKLDIRNAKKELASLEKEYQNTSRFKAKRRLRLSKQINTLKFKIKDFNSELDDFYSEENPVAKETPLTQEDVTTVQGQRNATNQQVVNGKTPFVELPIELKHRLAKLYHQYQLDTDPELKKKLMKAAQIDETKSAIQQNQDFEQAVMNIAPEDAYENLTENDIQFIQGLMQSNSLFIQAIVNHNVVTTPVAQEEQEQEEVEPVGINPSLIQVEEDVMEVGSEEGPILIDRVDLEDLLGEQIWNTFDSEQQQSFIDDINTGVLTEEDVLVAYKKQIRKKPVRKKAQPKIEKLGLPSEEQQERNDNWNRNVKILERGFVVDNRGKKVKVNKFDVPYIKEMFFAEMMKDDVTLQQAIANYARSTKALTESLKTSDFRFAIGREEQYDDIMDYIKELKKDRLLSRSVVIALNKSLDKRKSKFVIKAVGKASATKVARPYVPVSRDVKMITEKLSPGERINKNLESFYDFQNNNNYSTDIEKLEFILYKWLKTNKVNPEVFDPRELYLKDPNMYDANSQYRSLKGIVTDAFADEEVYIDREDFLADIVYSMLEYNSLSKMKQYFVDQMNRRVKEFEDQQQVFEPTADDVVYLPGEEDVMADYFNSSFYLISNGLFQGDPRQLSPSEKKLYDQIRKGDLSLTAGTLETKTTDFSNKLEAESLTNKPNHIVARFMQIMKKENLSLGDLVVASEYVNNTAIPFSMAQKKMMNQLIIEAIQTGNYSEEIVNLNGKVVKVLSTDVLGSIVIQEYEGQSIDKISSVEFLSSVKNIFETGDQFNFSDINTEVADDRTEILKDSFSDFFDNFIPAMNGVTALSDNDLNLRIRDQLNTCK